MKPGISSEASPGTAVLHARRAQSYLAAFANERPGNPGQALLDNNPPDVIFKIGFASQAIARPEDCNRYSKECEFYWCS
jgi:hypothetical protein